jgi:C-terminal processing protease CtpA/Prc
MLLKYSRNKAEEKHREGGEKIMKSFCNALVWMLVCVNLSATGNSAELQAPNQDSNQPTYLIPITPEKLKEDLDFLFKTIEEVHPNMYAYTSKEEFSKLREKLYQQVTQPMTRLEFYKAVAPVVASLKNGHTYMQTPDKEFEDYVLKGGKITPLVVHWNGESVLLKSYISSTDLPLGGEVLTINNQNAKDFLMRLARYWPSENKSYSMSSLEEGSSFSQYLWLDKGPSESLTLTIKAGDGTVKEYNVRWLSKQEIESEVASNKSKYELMSRSSHTSANYVYRYIAEGNTGLIEFNKFDNLEEFKKFLIETFKNVQSQNVPNLIIDLRTNPGGDSRLGDELLRYLTDKPFSQFEKEELKISPQACREYEWLKRDNPDIRIGSLKFSEGKLIQPGENPLRFYGRTFILIGSRTASSAMSFAAAVKHFRLGDLIGQETIDTPVNYGNCILCKMPNSGLDFNVASKRFICAGGKPDGHGVLPDYEVKQKPEDTAKGVDTVLQFTLNLIKEGSQNAQPKQEI